jgi:hypothetical protein
VKTINYKNPQIVPKSSLISLSANLNRVLIALCAIVWLVFFVLYYTSALEGITALIGLLAGLLGYLFPGIKDFHKQSWFRSRLITSGLSIVFAIGGMLVAYVIINPPLHRFIRPVPVNVSERFDFEEDVRNNISLDICDIEPPYSNCYDASPKISRSSASISGKYSLGIAINLSPEKAQIYSVNIPIAPPVYVEAISAYVFIPEVAVGSYLRFLARIRGENDEWNFSEILSTEAGWTRIFLDLQPFPDNEKNVDEVNIDLILPKGSANLPSEVRIDDIELHYSSSKLFNESIAEDTDDSSDPPLISALNYNFEDISDESKTAPWDLFAPTTFHSLLLTNSVAHSGTRSLQLSAELGPAPDYVGIKTFYPSVSNAKFISSWALIPYNENSKDKSFQSSLFVYFRMGNGDLIGFRSEEVVLEPGLWTPIQVGIPDEVDVFTDKFHWEGGIAELYLTFWCDHPYTGPIYMDDINFFTNTQAIP